MNAKKSLAALLFGFSSLAFAQEESKPLIQADALKNVDINLLLRSAYEVPENGVSGFKMNEARLEFRGKVVKDLEFRVRTRLHKADPVNDFDGAAGHLDIAYAAYKFGEQKNWEITFGKQNNMMGSWEFDKNPTFEYQYSKAVGGYNNLFAMGARLSYSPVKDQTFTIQGQNIQNKNFSVAGLEASKMPMLVQAAWQGNFFDKKFRTWYSVGTSEYAKDKRNFHLALGNKVVLGNFEAYLDLAMANFAYNHTSLTSLVSEDLNVKSAVLRMDYKFLPQWNVTAKGFYETFSATKDKVKGDNFQSNTGYLLGLEYQPIKTQNMKFFTYYYGNNVNFKKGLGTNTNSNMFSIGVLYLVNVL
ncbi:MAG: porin [Flavobacteriaceae bacterium]|nr:porin [Flavobacteriaceae bacterium]